MKVGNKKITLFVLIALLIFYKPTFSEENIEAVPLINLEELPATFEEDKESLEKKDLKSSIELSNTQVNTELKKNKKIIVNLKALDKITAKTSSINIPLGKIKRFGQLEIKPLKCTFSNLEGAPDTLAFIQVKDLSVKDNNQVFLFNGWTFASSPTLRSIDHPVYDLWLLGCENT